MLVHVHAAAHTLSLVLQTVCIARPVWPVTPSAFDVHVRAAAHTLLLVLQSVCVAISVRLWGLDTGLPLLQYLCMCLYVREGWNCTTIDCTASAVLTTLLFL